MEGYTRLTDREGITWQLVVAEMCHMRPKMSWLDRKLLLKKRFVVEKKKMTLTLRLSCNQSLNFRLLHVKATAQSCCSCKSKLHVNDRIVFSNVVASFETTQKRLTQPKFSGKNKNC